MGGTGADWSYYRKDYRDLVGFGRPVAVGGTGWYEFLRAFNASGKADQREPDPTKQLGRATYGLSDVYFRDSKHGLATGFNNITNTSFFLRTGTAARPGRPATSLRSPTTVLRHRPAATAGSGRWATSATTTA